MNVYQNCPLDARDFTDYRSSSDINNELKVKHNLKNSHEFNKFITNQGLQNAELHKNKIQQSYNCGDQKLSNDYSVKDNDLSAKNFKSY